MFYNPLEEYCLAHTTPQSDLLRELERTTILRSAYPRMISGALQGRFLSAISQMIKPKAILEIGTFTGFSALCLCEGLASHGELVTMDNNPEIEEFAKSFFNRSPFKNQINFVLGEALDVLNTLTTRFDLIYLDADKTQYPEYFVQADRLLLPGGWLLADNVLWGGKVLDSDIPKQKETKGIVTFNQLLASHQRYQVVMLPLRDGLTLARKIETI